MPILAELPSPRPLDLSMTTGLLDFGAWERPEAVRKAIASVAGTPVGRWGEVRLTRSGAPGKQAPAALHLGIDLYVEAGTRVRAPLAGTVERVGDAEMLLALAPPLAPARLRLAGLDASVEPGQEVGAGKEVGAVAAGPGPAHLHVQVCAGGPIPGLVRAREHEAGLALCPDPSPLLGIEAAAAPIESAAAAVARRGAVVASPQGLYYEEPPEIVRGWRHLLYDHEGRPYVDAVNNVALVGHSHPAIVAAAERQLRLLNTNSRFLYGAMAAYAGSLVALLPDGLDRVFFVNSGSEAADLALRLAREHTGGEDVLAVEGAYHGWTTGTFELCTNPADRPDWRRQPSARIHVLPQPDPYRGRLGTDAAPYVDSVRLACEAAAAHGGLAGFISEPLLGNQGGIEPPAGYLAGAYAAVRAAGGVCIADEVQVGLGRTGPGIWSFAQEGVVPDVVCVAKAAGNGYPVGAVICREEIAAGFGDGGFFSSPAGSPLSCEVGRTVIEVLLEERLPENAERVGELLRSGFERLAERHQLIGAVHGRGLYMGIDLVRDRASKEPATAKARAVCERVRGLGAIVQPTGDRGNVLKVKPPLCLDAEGAETIVAAIDRGLHDLA
ncbi:MAG: aminotransferase class III-fold pyridoxal phosphate-dependent enzyme [Solirubrobacterales bacterium]|nr:aminotransferase class III-fold pyridoxal phosphate-dependent enzyme [Solirubrobacterales bacterium]